MTQPASAGSASLPGTVDALTASLIALYADAEQQLMRQLAVVAAHRLNDSSATAQLLMLGEMRRAAQKLTTALRLRSGPLAARVIDEAAQRGDAAAVTALRAAVAGHPDLARLYLLPGGHRVTSANAIALDLASKLDAANLRIVRFADDAYRAAVADTSTRLVLGREQLTPATAQHRAWTELTRQGVTGYTDTRGRQWNLATYVEMATRTSVQRAYNASHEARMSSVGIEYFTVSHDGRPCPLCRPWEGAILGPHAGQVTTKAADSARQVSFTVKGTLAEAHAAGFQHPNCKHVLLAYLPGVTSTTSSSRWTADDQARYEATQQLRYLERQVRAAKRQQLAALNDLDRQRAARRVRAYQSRIRAHVGQHDLVRRRQREQLDLGNH